MNEMISIFVIVHIFIYYNYFNEKFYYLYILQISSFRTIKILYEILTTLIKIKQKNYLSDK